VKRFRFGLEHLLKVKEQRERLAEARVAQARQELTLCQERIEKLNGELGEVALRLERLLGKVLPAETWAGTFDQSSRLERAIREAEVKLVKAEAALRDAIQARTRISTEVEALETLREQHLDAYRQDLQRAEQIRLDEISMRQWIQKLRKDLESSQGKP
jgi:flagellar FliJ protein